MAAFRGDALGYNMELNHRKKDPCEASFILVVPCQLWNSDKTTPFLLSCFLPADRRLKHFGPRSAYVAKECPND